MKNKLIRRIVLCCGVAIVVASVAFFPAGPAPAQTAATQPSTNALAHTLTATNAAAAWQELQDSTQPPSPPVTWQLQEPTPEERTQFILPYALALADRTKDFYSRFASDTNALDAREKEFGILSWAVEAGATNQQERFAAAKKSLLADPGLPEDDRFDIRNEDVKRAVQSKEAGGDAAMLAEFEKGVRDLQKEFPKRPEIFAMLMGIAEDSDPEKARAIVKEIAAGDAPQEVKSDAAELGRKLDRVGKPLTLKFTAIDGREVDLAKLGGKVVLVDFWATWCEPCLAALPDIKDAYAAMHEKGFEIIGVSLDDDKESVTNLVSQEKLAWPQYFDGMNTNSKYAVEFGVKQIPALWLVDKKGILRDISAEMNLTNKVGKLLAE